MQLKPVWHHGSSFLGCILTCSLTWHLGLAARWMDGRVWCSSSCRPPAARHQVTSDGLTASSSWTHPDWVTRPYFRGWKSVSQIKSVSCQSEQLRAHLCTDPAVQSAPWCDSPVGRTAEQRGGRETLQSLLNSWEMIKNRDVTIVECFINRQICSWLIDRHSNHQLSFLNLLSKQNKVKYCLFVLIFCCVPLRSIKNHHHTSAERCLIFMCRCFTHTVVCSSSFVEAERRRLMLETSSEH